MTSTVDVVRSLPDRLLEVQQAVDDAEAALKLRREQRRQLVHEVVDHGVMSQRKIAAALGKGTGLVALILATPGPDQ
jgi:hypothetical protein